MENYFKKKEIFLYHGSRGGIEGAIQPISRSRCDFGKGFYLGDNPMQAKGLVAADPDPFLYEMKLHLDRFPPQSLVSLNGEQWLYTVLACRNRVPEFSKLKLAKHALDLVKRAQIIAGPIADDRMNEAIRRFEQNGMTDQALMKCLQSVDYGLQYVLKTSFACKQIEILSYHEVYNQEMQQARDYTDRKRQEGSNIVNQMCAKYNRSGKFLYELIEEQKEKDRYRERRDRNEER